MNITKKLVTLEKAINKRHGRQPNDFAIVIIRPTSLTSGREKVFVRQVRQL